MAQCVIFFLSGQEAVSTTITFAAYQLALNSVIQENLRKEVDECIAANGPEPSLEVISKLKYLHCVVSETLRILPSASRLERCGYNDYVLGNTGIKLPKGCTVFIPVYAMHHDPEFFPDPESFKPERFSEENVGSIRPYTYLPFGAGPRNCIGSRFFLQTIRLCLFHSVNRACSNIISASAPACFLRRQKAFPATPSITEGSLERKNWNALEPLRYDLLNGMDRAVVPSFDDSFQSGQGDGGWTSDIWVVGWRGKLCGALFDKEVHDSKCGVARRIVVTFCRWSGT
ncbi:cytochrome P450 3A19-like [Rhipicephalus sanguineus]|uniref:cytochrome P450 3A19-like n=1 Tax=Rhipicephalus sanguineus TaxID=34632 RepID=UPI0020C401CE|nr:cytochrome P450 3A19-like [Rhipicephalus sanguineus]